MIIQYAPKAKKTQKILISCTLSQSPALPLKILTPLADMSVTEKQEIFLEVKVNKPGQTPIWMFENKEVSTSEHIQLKSEGLIHRLVIKSATLDDEGVYKVVFGDIKSSANVLVDGELQLFHKV